MSKTSILLTGILLVAWGCGGGGETTPPATISVTLTPNAANVHVNRSIQFTATVRNSTNAAVTWSVSGAGCSGITCGMISSTGLYTAPGNVPSPATVTVKATSAADTSKSASATITILASVVVTVSPPNPFVAIGATQQFTATVQNAIDSSVTWTVSGSGCTGSECGTISTAGLYTAPSVVPAAPAISITATSVEDTAISDSATATIVSSVTSIKLAKTGQTLCYSDTGTGISCVGTGQDGELQKGVAWPDPRYTDNGDGTVTDHLTGLMWLKDANCIRTYDTAHVGSEFDKDGSVGDGAVSWLHALDFVKGINAGTYAPCAAGYHDWRLPNVNELLSLHDFSRSMPALQTGHPFANIAQWEYWSSTSAGGNGAWAVSMYLGLPVEFAKGFWNIWVWPVRGSASGTVQLAKTGQTMCYDVGGGAIPCPGTGQDGESQTGVAWPIARFTDNGDGTITDNLTGLMWLKDANCAQTAGYDPDLTGNGSTTWQNALNFVKGVNAGTYSVCSAGYTDWRLSNVVEMISLASPNQNYTLTWLVSAGFSNVQDGLHWSSTTDVNLAGYALVMYSGNGVWPIDLKTNKRYFWLVR
jgi:hypothetical protein